MKRMYEVKAKATMAVPGVWDYEAEAKVTGPDTAEETFVYAATDGVNKTFKVSGESVMAYLSSSASEEADPEFDEAIMKYAHGELSQEEIEKWGFGENTSICSEEYEKLSTAKKSKYYGVFKVLNSLLNAMAKETVEE